MDVKEAVQIAKEYIGELFKSEGAVNIGLEEIDYSEDADVWRITIGLSRPWDRMRSFLGDQQAGENAAFRRAYKVVSIDQNRRVLSVKKREWEEA